MLIGDVILTEVPTRFWITKVLWLDSTTSSFGIYIWQTVDCEKMQYTNYWREKIIYETSLDKFLAISKEKRFARPSTKHVRFSIDSAIFAIFVGATLFTN